MRFLLPACLLAAGCVNIPAFQGGGSGSGNPDGGPGSGLQLRVLDHAYYDGGTTMTGSPGMSQLPEVAAHATCPELQDAFNNHLEQTRQHVERLRRIFNAHGITADAVVCDAMKGLLTEARKHLAETTPGDVRDAVLIASGNRIEHYEIAGYGVAKAFANTLGFGDDADILDETLQEEGAADQEITKIATGGLFRSGVNEAASHV